MRQTGDGRIAVCIENGYMRQTGDGRIAVCIEKGYMRQTEDGRIAVCIENWYMRQTEDGRIAVCIENWYMHQTGDHDDAICMKYADYQEIVKQSTTVFPVMCHLHGNLIRMRCSFPSNSSFTRKSLDPQLQISQ
ncbi:hypothetical protein J416_04291 [Gracilibacillus halophilus YIM-C55.5]|uniref:Uncharacterized protein n=1 Tax=Gracilibacillus halophilus YIM-C55.5 TaxID=1308866 RepID=N4WBS2_9BACI|nr:hypothetical protein [Gracilibacillus halophilus]ENH97748.1 hypothetical protein J416_04291 [Gracilibacillus halophilus YIM-C55.5]